MRKNEHYVPNSHARPQPVHSPSRLSRPPTARPGAPILGHPSSRASTTAQQAPTLPDACHAPHSLHHDFFALLAQSTTSHSTSLASAATCCLQVHSSLLQSHIAARLTLSSFAMLLASVRPVPFPPVPSHPFLPGPLSTSRADPLAVLPGTFLCSHDHQERGLDCKI